MRGGLDDALERLARRDRLRRQHDQQAGGPPPAVSELVEAIADVVGRNPELTLTIGVEGAGSPLLLHVAMEDGVVRVTASDPPDTVTPHHTTTEYDFEVEVDESYQRPSSEARHAYEWSDVNYDPDPSDYEPQLNGYGASSFHDEEPVDDRATVAYDHSTVMPPPAAPRYGSPHPTPYVVPAPATRPSIPPMQRTASSSVQPPPLARPIPLKVEGPEETEQAARRLAALLREDPSLLH